MRTASDRSPGPCRLYVTDRHSKTKYLGDTGSDVSVFPHAMMQSRQQPEPYELYAANGSRITTYGFVTLQPDLGLRRTFPWRFVVANVGQPIIGSDFLAYYDLIPDMRRAKLKDPRTGLLTTGSRCYHRRSQ